MRTWSKTDVFIALALTALSFCYLWPFRSALAAVDLDEGILLQGADRILHGQLPYRDFFAFYTPGSYYWHALLLKIFGGSILVPRTVLVVYGMLFSLLTYILARRLAGRLASVFVTLLLLVCCMPVRFAALHNWDSTVSALLALYCGILFLETHGKWPAALAGFFTALTILSNQARGAALLLGLVLGLLLLHLRLGRKDLKAKDFVWIAAGLFPPLIFTALFFGLHGGLSAMVDCLVWPLRHYTRANWLPYGYVTMPSTTWVELFGGPSLISSWFYCLAFTPIFVICALPVGMVLVAAACVFFHRSDLEPAQASVIVMCGAVVAGVLLATATTRADFIHITFLLPLFFFALPWVFQTWAAPFHSLRRFGPALLAYVLIAGAFYGLTLMRGATDPQVALETRRGRMRVTQQIETVRFIQANFPAGSTLLVYPYLPLYSFLTQTRSPLRYDYFQPGMHAPEQFEEAARQLAILRPRAVLFEPDFDAGIPIRWPHTPVTNLQEPLADYIAKNYRLCRVLDAAARDRFWFMVRKDLSCESWKPTG